MAPAQVLHGAVRLHGLASSPTPDTQVRLAWALIKLTPNRTVAKTFSKFIVRIWIVPLSFRIDWLGSAGQRAFFRAQKRACTVVIEVSESYQENLVFSPSATK